MRTIIGIAGSLRQRSYNLALLEAARRCAPTGTDIEVATLRGIPLYDADVEKSAGLPAAVVELKKRIVAADAILLSTPEYNHSIPGVLKNAIDWLSRPPSDIERVFEGRPVGLIGASPGMFGTTHSQSAWLPVLRALKAQPYFGQTLRVPRVADAINEGGEVVDSELERRLQRFIEGFSEFIGTITGRS